MTNPPSRAQAPRRSAPDGARLTAWLIEQLDGAARERALQACEGGGAAGGTRLLSAPRLHVLLRAAGLDAAGARRLGRRFTLHPERVLALRRAGISAPERAYRSCGQLLPHEDPAGRYEARSVGARAACIAVHSGSPPEPLACALRAGMLEGLARALGAARVRVVESACAAHGDPQCVYRIAWRTSGGARPVLAAALLAAALAAAAGAGGLAADGAAGLALAPAVGAGLLALGAASLWRRAARPRGVDDAHALHSEIESQIAARMDELARVESALECSAEPARGRAHDPAAGALRIARMRAALRRARRALAEASAPGEAALRALADLEAQIEALGGPPDGGAPEGDAEPLAALIETSARAARGPHTAAVDVSIAPALAEVRCEARALRRAVDALLVDALDAAGAQGRVRIGAQPVAGAVEIAIAPLDIDADAAEAACDPFAGAAATGPACSLAAAAALAARHGGALRVEPEADGRGRVVLALPAAQQARPGSEAASNAD